MINLDFQIDKRYLVYYTLTQTGKDRFVSGQPDHQVVAFQNRAWEMDEDAYRFLRSGIDATMLVEQHSIAHLGSLAERLLQEMMDEPSFQIIYEQTQHALSLVHKEWMDDYSCSHEIMSDLTGLDLDKTLSVYITHPSQKNGSAGIFWTYRQDFPHYNTVYLWHEIMHHFILRPAYGEPVHNVEHAIIEFLTDEELRVRFNGGQYPPFIGHDSLKDFKLPLLESWHAYLECPEKNINQYLAAARTTVGAA